MVEDSRAGGGRMAPDIRRRRGCLDEKVEEGKGAWVFVRLCMYVCMCVCVCNQ